MTVLAVLSGLQLEVKVCSTVVPVVPMSHHQHPIEVKPGYVSYVCFKQKKERIFKGVRGGGRSGVEKANVSMFCLMNYR